MEINLTRLETRTYNITAEELYKILKKYYEMLNALNNFIEHFKSEVDYEKQRHF
ncbi:TPA: hypothetical protein ACSYYG_08075 [Listeria monocytogenes]|nr:hypothetical protein [Listeria monocytogenes]